MEIAAAWIGPLSLWPKHYAALPPSCMNPNTMISQLLYESKHQPRGFTTVTRGIVARSGKEYVYPHTNDQSEIYEKRKQKVYAKLGVNIFFAQMM